MQKSTEVADPILDEIHAVRRSLISEHGGISGLADFLRQQQAQRNQASQEIESQDGANAKSATTSQTESTKSSD